MLTFMMAIEESDKRHGGSVLDHWFLRCRRIAGHRMLMDH